eukprot:CAMPEP_0113552192 /NCGR_PEP_ID=MMETSP0015_2-20120614/14932_1 /TAXON_ID=2838 /ORGANISM="Odontella" /LENGTH=456 /DNA_ID=CAMNT_0000453145 /DNA_START=392 /DNA_END=1762 /DNA_ORIENTATION=- /assembly_acc=CAM_ASM_000160
MLIRGRRRWRILASDPQEKRAFRLPPSFPTIALGLVMAFLVRPSFAFPQPSALRYAVNRPREVPRPLSAEPGRSSCEDSQAKEECSLELSEEDCWNMSLALTSKPYVSSLLHEMDEESLSAFIEALDMESVPLVDGSRPAVDPLWEQLKLEARAALEDEPQAGPQLYSLILSQRSLLSSLSTIVANEIETELMPATSIKNLFLEQLTPADHRSICLDIMAAAMRSPSVGTALNAVLHDRGVHALVCYRVGHRLWLAGRKGLAYYMQSTVSSKYSSDIHPACRLGDGIFLRSQGVVIGETAVVGDDTSISQGVTLGGTGKEAGDRHPKVGNAVILHDSATVLGNIPVGDGAVITAKSIVTKPVPPLARVSGVPAKIRSYREEGALGGSGSLLPDENAHDMPVEFEEITGSESSKGSGDQSFDEKAVEQLEKHLSFKYMQQWGDISQFQPEGGKESGF